MVTIYLLIKPLLLSTASHCSKYFTNTNLFNPRNNPTFSSFYIVETKAHRFSNMCQFTQQISGRIYIQSKTVRLLRLCCCPLLCAPSRRQRWGCRVLHCFVSLLLSLLLPSCPGSLQLPPPDPQFAGPRFTFWSSDLTLAHILSSWFNICSLLPALFLYLHFPPWPSDFRNNLVFLAFILQTLWLSSWALRVILLAKFKCHESNFDMRSLDLCPHWACARSQGGIVARAELYENMTRSISLECRDLKTL